jgi:hypothetical protein
MTLEEEAQQPERHPWSPLRGAHGIVLSGPIIYPSLLRPGELQGIVDGTDQGPRGESAGSGAGDYASPKFSSAPRAARAARKAAAARRRGRRR